MAPFPTDESSGEIHSPNGTQCSEDKEELRWRYSRGDRSRRDAPHRRVLRTIRRYVVSPVVPFVVPAGLAGLARTWRVAVVREDLQRDVLLGDNGCVAVLWHGRMAAAAALFHGVDASILVSASGDGKLADTFLSRLGYRTLRGSTGKISARALRELRGRLDGGGVIALTPDGPRGPRHHVNRGAWFLARATGRPILPIGIAARPALHLRSWDRFTIPRPFARVQVVFGEPIEWTRGGDSESTAEEVCSQIQSRLLAAETEAFAALGQEVDW